MLCYRAAALAAIVCVANAARIKGAPSRIIEEQPLGDQLGRAASAARISHHDEELSLDELLALDDRVMPATAPPSAPTTRLQVTTRSKKRNAPEVPATALQMATLRFIPSKKRKATEDEVGQNRVATEAEKEEMLLDDLGLGLDEAEHRGIEGEVGINELLNYMAAALEDEANEFLVRSGDEAQASGGSIDDLWGQDDIAFVEAMQKYEQKKCTSYRFKSGREAKISWLKDCCKVARIWTNCDHGVRFLASMLRRFNHLCKCFPSLPRHQVAKVASLQELGLLPKAASGEGSGSGIGKWLRANWVQNSSSRSSRGHKAKDPCVGRTRSSC